MTSLRARVWLFWLGAYALTTLILSSISALPHIRVSHGVLGYFVLIIVASRSGGRALSLVLVALSYLALDLLFVPPRFTLLNASELDWIVLLGFLATGWLLSDLFASEREARRVAEERIAQVEQLSRDRERLEQEASTARVLKEADRLKNALLTSVAHDLRSPVATLSLLADPGSGFTAAQALQRVGNEAARLSDFINTLQRFSRDDSGTLLLSNRHAAEQLVHTALRSSEASLNGRVVNVAASEDEAVVIGDFTLAVQVLGNLLQNAVRYSPTSAPVDVQIVRRDTTVDISVADRGVGISGDVELLFTPLRRRARDGETASAASRMGMGLSIARMFARAQRGDVLYAPRDDGGSVFTLRLPRAHVSEPPLAT